MEYAFSQKRNKAKCKKKEKKKHPYKKGGKYRSVDLENKDKE